MRWEHRYEHPLVTRWHASHKRACEFGYCPTCQVDTEMLLFLLWESLELLIYGGRVKRG